MRIQRKTLAMAAVTALLVGCGYGYDTSDDPAGDSVSTPPVRVTSMQAALDAMHSSGAALGELFEVLSGEQRRRLQFHDVAKFSSSMVDAMVFVQYPGPTTGEGPVYDGRFNVEERPDLTVENLDT